MQRETTKQNFTEENREEAYVLFMVWTKKNRKMTQSLNMLFPLK